MSREPQYRITDLTKRISSLERPTLPSRQPPVTGVHCCLPIISPPPPIVDLLNMHSGDQESGASQNSRDIGQATSTNISPQPPSTIASDVAPINMLLDEVLLEIFVFYVEESR